MKPIPLSNSASVFFKVGSTWSFGIRRGTQTLPINITGCTARSSFRSSSVNGPVVVTLDETTGLSIPSPADGITQYVLTPAQTVLFPSGAKIYLDLELTDVGGVIWQSPTYYFTPDPEVTV